MKQYYYVHYKEVSGYRVFRMTTDGTSEFVVSYEEPETAAYIANMLTKWAEDES